MARSLLTNLPAQDVVPSSSSSAAHPVAPAVRQVSHFDDPDFSYPEESDLDY